MERTDFRDQISRNKRKSFFLVIVIFTVFTAMGYVISMAFDPSYFFMIMAISVIFTLSYVLISYYNSGRIAVASVGARKAEGREYREYHGLVEGLCIASGLPKPKLYVMDSEQINAFASGRNPENSVICVTEGALEKLEKRELEGVLAHELGHVANFDIRYMTIAAVMVGIVAIVSQIFLRSLWFQDGDGRNNWIFIVIGIAMAIIAPIAVWLVQMSISRKREFTADASAVKFTRYPEGLIGALKKIKHDSSPPEKEVNRAVAPLFISNPFKNAGSTHPPLDERIKALERM